MEALKAIDDWPVAHAAVAVIDGRGVVARRGPTTLPLRIASVSKLLTTCALMIAVEEGTVALDDPAGPPGSTLRHLLAHASGYGFDSTASALAAPGTRRIYSNRGIEEAAAHLAAAAGLPFATYLHEAVLEPLGLGDTTLRTSAAFGIWSTVDDLGRFAGELFAPRLLAPATLGEMVTVQFPGLSGVLPGVRRYERLDWGLGFERNFGTPGHWAGGRVSRAAYGHFGGSGTFLWLDPAAGLAVVMLADREFEEWGMAAWPPLCDAIVAEHTGRA